MAAQFYGSVLDSQSTEYGGMDEPEARRSFEQQEYQSAMLMFEGLKEDMRKIRSEIGTLQKNVEEVRADRSSPSVNKSKGSNKLRDGISVSCSMHMVSQAYSMIVPYIRDHEGLESFEGVI